MPFFFDIRFAVEILLNLFLLICIGHQGFLYSYVFFFFLTLDGLMKVLSSAVLYY